METFLQIVLLFFVLYLALFKSYFQEKGKNIATSEDIEGLTLKVESVKQQFLEKNANVKAKLDLLTSLQINHKNDERTALIEFHKAVKNWIGLLTESTPSLLNYYDNDEIQAKKHYYDLAYREVLHAEYVLELYVDDVKIWELIRDLKVNVIENLAVHPIKFLLDIQANNESKKHINPEKHYDDELDKIYVKRRAIFSDYQDNMLNGLKLIKPFEQEYVAYVREYISKIPLE